MESAAKRNSLGQFVIGYQWREPKPYWNKDFLFTEYIIKQKSTYQIAKENGCGDTNIQSWLKKFGIKSRTTSEIRKIKYWGAVSAKNPMYGRFGQLNPNWHGGHSPERQCYYNTHEWKKLKRQILERDNYVCQKCGSHIRLEIHHIKRWSRFPELRHDPDNLVTLCYRCHR